MNNHRRKTAWILIAFSTLMLSPIIMDFFGWTNPLFHNLGILSDSTTHPLVWILALAIALAYIWFIFKKVPFVQQMQKELSFFKLIGIISAIASGLMEELVFRRWLMDAIFYFGYNEFIQVIFSGLFFGLGHIIWFFFNKEIKFVLPAILGTTILGCVLALLYIIGGRNVGPCIIAHILINLVIEPWLMLSSVSGMWGKDDKKNNFS